MMSLAKFFKKNHCMMEDTSLDTSSLTNGTRRKG
jgi:hypothetical protein